MMLYKIVFRGTVEVRYRFRGTVGRYLGSGRATLTKDNTVIEEYEEKNSTLKLRLTSADEEIEHLNIQNMQLKISVEKSSKVIALYKKIGITENSLNAISTPVIRKVKKVFSGQYPGSPRHTILETNEVSTQTTDNSMTKYFKKPYSSKKNKQQIKERRRKINNLINKIAILKTQNKKLMDELKMEGTKLFV